jgi:hypothetical protein
MYKKLILSLVAVIAISVKSFGQAPEGFKYQAVVRDANNIILNNENVGVRMTIQQGSIGGTMVYRETFATTTTANGLVNLEIGNGSVVSGNFTTIDWGNGPYFIETAVDVTGGTTYQVMGTSQLMSVPYALHAKTAESVTNDQVDDADADPSNEFNTGATLTGTTLSISDAGGSQTVDLSSLQDGVDDADADPSNELQTLSLVGSTLTLSDGGGSASINDADANPVNELQTLSVAGNNLTISGGNTVTLPTGTDADWTISGNNMYAIPTGNVGIGVSTPERKLDVIGDVKTEKIFIGSRVINVVNGVPNFAWTATPLGIRLATNIPNNDTQKFHSVTFTGHHTGSLLPIEIKVSWCSNNGGFTAMSSRVTSAASTFNFQAPTVKLNTEGGKVVVYIENPSPNFLFYYNLSVDAMFNYFYNQMDRTWYDGWTLTRMTAAIPVGATSVPVETIEYGTLKANEVKLGLNPYTGITNGATIPVPTGGVGTIVFSGTNFFGWNGTSWRQLDN